VTFTDRPIDEFLDSVASRAVAPSAGAVAGVSAASGTALCEMVCVHTIGKEGYAAVEEELREVRENLGDARTRLLELADADAEAVDQLRRALDRDGNDEDAGATEASVRLVVEIPLEVAEICREVLDIAPEVVEKGAENAREDGLTGVLLTHAALQSSLRLVRANLEDVGDAAFVAEVGDRVRRLEADADRALERAFSAGE